MFQDPFDDGERVTRVGGLGLEHAPAATRLEDHDADRLRHRRIEQHATPWASRFHHSRERPTVSKSRSRERARFGSQGDDTFRIGSYRRVERDQPREPGKGGLHDAMVVAAAGTFRGAASAR
jgi:hypothetical protein